MKRLRVLIDECVDRRLSRYFTEYHVQTVPEMGWASKKNGELLRLAENEFDIFLTVDKNLPSQQKLETLQLAVIVVRAKSNSLSALIELIPDIKETLPIAKIGTATFVGT